MMLQLYAAKMSCSATICLCKSMRTAIKISPTSPYVVSKLVGKLGAVAERPWFAEDVNSKEGSPDGAEGLPKGHPSTPTKRKTSPSDAEPSSSNKVLKGMS